ncbi:16973_t:CDS:2, partial [Racocetra fulgida]
AVGTYKLESFWSSVNTSTDDNFESSDNYSETDTETENYPNLSSFIELLKIEVKTKNYNKIESACLHAILFYLRLVKCGKGRIEASVIVAKAAGKNTYCARSIRAWASNYIQNGVYPISRQGKYPKT